MSIIPIVIHIRQTSTIEGFKQGIRDDKLSLYADNAPLCLGDTDQSLISAMTLITTFGPFLGFDINWERSVLFPVDEP